jgi:hypothetical protein
MNTNQGEITRDGVTIRWLFDPTRQILEIQCTDAPFLVPCSTVNGRIQELVNGLLERR